MSTDSVKLTVSVPRSLVKLADTIAKEKKTSRSKVVAACLQELAKQRLEKELEEGYRAMSKKNLETASVSFGAQSEAVLRDT